MPIAFIGDTHGCVRHALAATIALQTMHQCRFDAVIQVGDFGAHPAVGAVPLNERPYLDENPAQGDVFAALSPDPAFADQLAAVKARLPEPGMLFISGNHEDDAWLASLHDQAAGAPVVPIDPLSVFHHVRSGEVLTLGDGTTLAVVGGCAAPGLPFDLSGDALARLHSLEPGSVDVLVTHDGPHGICENWQGRIQGSRRISRLIEHLQPRIHVSGHYHHADGPRSYGATRSWMLAQLVAPKSDRWGRKPPNPTQRVSPGSIGVLDRHAGTFAYVTEEWLAEIHGDELDLGAYLDRWQ